MAALSRCANWPPATMSDRNASDSFGVFEPGQGGQHAVRFARLRVVARGPLVPRPSRQHAQPGELMCLAPQRRQPLRAACRPSRRHVLQRGECDR